LTLSAATTAAAGGYTIAIAGTGGGLTRIGSLTLASTANPGFTLSANPTSVAAAHGGKASTTITAAISSGFDGQISLSASGMPAGVSASFNPSSIAAPGAGS